MLSYSEIDALENLLTDHRIRVTPIENSFLGNDPTYPAVQFQLDESRFLLYVDNEYNDLERNLPLLNLALVLRALDAYAFADDYLQWCTHHGLAPSNDKTRSYYMDLARIYREVEQVIGPFECPVSDYDFELNAGAAQMLRTQMD